MISKLAYKGISTTIKVFSLLGITPFEWDKETKRMTVCQKKWKQAFWLAAALINFMVWISLIMALITSLSQETPSIENLVLLICCLGMWTLSVSFNLTFIIQGPNVVAEVTNQMFELDDKLAALEIEFRARKKKSHEVDYIGFIVWVSLPLGITMMAFFSVFFAITDFPFNLKLNISLEKWPTYREVLILLIRGIFAFFNGMLMLPVFGVLQNGVIYVQFAKHWMKFVDNVNSTAEALKIYSWLKVHNQNGNRYTKSIIAPAMAIVCHVQTVVSICSTIKLRDRIEPTAYMFMLILFAIMMTLNVLLVQQTSVMYSMSSLFLSKKQKSANKKMRRIAKAMAPIRVSFGDLGYCDKSFVLTYWGYITDNTVNLLVSLN